ncbi:conserved hypothetical protein [Ricinus communis]|uniref:Uncharacterized protein n=1 Tax=Ricinus communis TaxID=3988 RepID=B9SPU8_RICCO|nr:conserved hypothetical protein [Ricinus communis]
MSHDITPMGQLHEQLHEGLNVDQKNIHESITDSVKSTRGKLFFVHGHGAALLLPEEELLIQGFILPIRCIWGVKL